MRSFLSTKTLETCFLSLVVLFVLADAQPYNPQDCATFLALGFNFFDFDRYAEFFNETSVLTLAQTGNYVGPEAIEEYVRFTHDSSPFVIENTALSVQVADDLFGFDPTTGVCTFVTMTGVRNVYDPEFTNGETINYAFMAKFQYSIPNNNIAEVAIYYPDGLLSFFFGTVLNTDQTRAYVCEVYTGESCKETNTMYGDRTFDECMASLEALAISEDTYVDGNTQGCRAVHSIFAAINPGHCPHLSFEPAVDPNGKVKCQVSDQIPISSLFSDNDIAAFDQYLLDTPEIGTDEGFVVIATQEPVATPTEPTMAPSMGQSSTATPGPKLTDFLPQFLLICSLLQSWWLVELALPH